MANKAAGKLHTLPFASQQFHRLIKMAAFAARDTVHQIPITHTSKSMIPVFCH